MIGRSSDSATVMTRFLVLLTNRTCFVGTLSGGLHGIVRDIARLQALIDIPYPGGHYFATA